MAVISVWKDAWNCCDCLSDPAFAGSLTLHGVTKTVTGAVDVRQAGAGLRVKASFPVNLPDYSIRKPRYLGIGVKDIVQVEVAFAVTR